MRLSLVLVFCVSLKFTFSAVIEKNKINKDERTIKKTPGRLSRIKWQVHEKGMADLDNAMFNDNKMGKARYKKMNYNVQIQNKKNKNNPSTARVTGKPVNIKQKIKEGTDDTTKIELDELTEQIEGGKKKRKIGKKINIGWSDFKRTFKKVPNIKERNQFYRRDLVEHNELDEDFKRGIKTTRQRKTPNKEKQPETIAQNYEAQMNTHTMNLNRPLLNQKKTKLKHEKLIQNTGQTMQTPKTGIKIKKRVKKVYENPKAQRNLINNDRLKSTNNIHEGADLVKTIRRKSLRLSVNERLQQLKLQQQRDSASSVLEFLAKTPKDDRELKKVHNDDDPSIANELYRKVRILCWVITHPANHNLTLKAIKSTWGRRCNKLLFISTELNSDKNVPTIKLNVPEGRDNLWVKNRAAFKYVYENYYDAYDWYVRTDDDTYMVMENLRYMLAYYNPSDPLFFGCRFKPYATQGYMSGGAGVVLSRDALNKLGRGLNDSELCDFEDATDDVNLGICLHRVGVKAVDSRDSLQKIRFLPMMPQDLMDPHQDETFWYWSFVYYPTEPGIGCCSDYTISFHYVAPADMYAFEFLIYRVRAFGIRHGNAPIPPLITQTTQRHDAREKSSETPERILPTVKDNEDGMKSSTMTLEEIARRLDEQGFELPTEKFIKEEPTESSTQEEVTEKITKATKIVKEINATTPIYHFINYNKYFKKPKTATTEAATTEIITTETATTETATTETATTETATTETVITETATTESATTETTTHKYRLSPVFYDDVHNYKVKGIATRNNNKTNLYNRVIKMIDSNSIEIAKDFTTEKASTESIKYKRTLPEFEETSVSEEEFTIKHKIEPQMAENRH